MPRSDRDPPDLAGPAAVRPTHGDLERAALLLSAADDEGVARVALVLASLAAEGGEFSVAAGSAAPQGAGAGVVARARGGVSPERAAAIEERDRQLVALWRASPEWRDLSPYVAGRLMSLSARRYGTTAWARDAGRGAAPAVEPAATWWRILRAGLPVSSARHLRRVLSD